MKTTARLLLALPLTAQAQFAEPGFESYGANWLSTCGFGFSSDVPVNGGSVSVNLPMHTTTAYCYLTYGVYPLIYQELPLVQNGDEVFVDFWMKSTPDVPANEPYMTAWAFFGWMTSPTSFSYDMGNPQAQQMVQAPMTWTQGGFSCTISGLPPGATAAILLGGHGVSNASGLIHFDNVTMRNTTVGSGVKVTPKMLLEGSYPGTGLMRDDLRTGGWLPLTEPCTALFGSAAGGNGETTTATVLAVSGSNAVVDWVHVELRLGGFPWSLVATRNGLLQRDGDVVAVDGLSPLTFNVGPGNYFVAVRHRNHLGAMTYEPPPLTHVTTTIDFRSPTLATYTRPAPFNGPSRKTIGLVQALWAGNTHLDGPYSQLKYTGTSNDRDPILWIIGGSVPTATFTGYRVEDVNMDGVVKYTGVNNDRDPILTNIGGSTPTVVRYEQLP